MSGRHDDQTALDERPRPGESFLERFHRRKAEARTVETAPTAAPTATREEPDAVDEAGGRAPPPTDADMPPIDSLTADSDYSGFLSERVSEGLRRAALRKLFHGAEFNVVDGLDEYAEDYTTFEALGGILTADMRHRLEVEARRKAEAVRDALVDGDGEDVADRADDATADTAQTGAPDDEAQASVAASAHPHDSIETRTSDDV